MEIELSIKGRHGAFFIDEEGERLAEMAFSFSGPSKMTIIHTKVSKVLGGKGIGKQLVAMAVDYARKHHMKITPICPFAKSILNITPEYADVLN